MKSHLHAWLLAIRLRTLLIPTVQVVVGTGLAYAFVDKIAWGIAFGAWVVAVLITIGTNLVNDAIDFEHGGDQLGRFGQKKVIRAGLLSKNAILSAGLLSLALACLIPFMLHVSWEIRALVVLSAICGYCYTGGPFPISYLGLSELFILIFYGGICVIAPFYVQTQVVNEAAILAAIQLGLLAILPNALNNFRDIYEDASINKNTLAVRFGMEFARWEIMTLTIIPFILNFLWLILGYIEAFLMPFLIGPLAVIFIRKIWKAEPSPKFNRYFALSVFVHFFFGVLLTIGFALH